MALPPLFQASTLSAVPYLKSDGVTRPDSHIGEPGTWYDDSRNDVISCHYPEVVQVSDFTPTGTFNSSATWTLTVTPLTTQSGAAAAAHGMVAESVSFAASGSTAVQVVAGLVAAVATAATTLTTAALATWNRLASFVTVEVSPASTGKLRLTARSSAATFSAVITSTLAGDSYTETVITSPVTDTLKVGFYAAIDTTKGTNGRDANGKPYLKAVTSTTPANEIVGPIFLGSNTNDVARGFAYREYEAGRTVPAVSYGHCVAYGESAIALASGPEAVYVRHTTSGDYLAGLAADATRAAVGATANVWTGTPTVTNSVLYVVDIDFNGTQTTLKYVADGSAADTEIVAGLKAQLALFNTSSGPLYGITATSATTTIVLTGPSDGRAFTPSTIGAAGAITWVETTAEVSTHTLLTRGDKFIAPSTRIGSIAVDVPHSNA